MFNRSGWKKLRKTPGGRGVATIPNKLNCCHHKCRPLIAIPHTHVLKASGRTDTLFKTLNCEIEYPDKDSRRRKPYIPSSGEHSRLGRQKGALSRAKLCLKAAHPWDMNSGCILEERPSCNDTTFT